MTAVSAATPRLTGSYGSFLFDESTGCLIVTEYDARDTPEAGSLYFEFHCRLVTLSGDDATDDAAFKALIAALETALKIPRAALLVSIGVQPFRSWSSADGTAFVITPELTLISGHAYDFKYGFKVTCQLPGNVPANVNRRESMTRVGTSLGPRRTCTISATWTASNGVTAYARYLASGDAFYNAYLPGNLTDQHGSVGVWVRLDEGNDGGRNDENSLITVSRVYWEIFAGRRESNTKTISTIDGRRACLIAAMFVASGSSTALQNFTDNNGAFAAAQLPPNVGSGSWVLTSTDPAYVDSVGTLQVLHRYEEVVNGLRSYSVEVKKDLSGIRHVVIAGTYYATGSTARLNYTNNIAALIAGALAAEGITLSEPAGAPKTGYGTTGLTYDFRWQIDELVYAQPLADNVTFESLELKVNRPFGQTAIPSGIPITRLSVVDAFFVATIDKDSSGGDDPTFLWDNGLKSHVITKITSKLGAAVSAVQVIDEDVDVILSASQIIGRLKLVVTGGSVLWLTMSQTITQVPGIDFEGLASGEAFKYFPYRDLPEKLLHREGACEYIVGETPPVMFASGDEEVSGFDFEPTGKTAQESIDEQNDPGEYDPGTDVWVIDRRAPKPLAITSRPTSRGDGGTAYRTVVLVQVEDWRFISSVVPGTEIS